MREKLRTILTRTNRPSSSCTKSHRECLVGNSRQKRKLFVPCFIQRRGILGSGGSDKIWLWPWEMRGLEIVVDGETLPFLGRKGQVIRSLSLNLEYLKDLLKKHPNSPCKDHEKRPSRHRITPPLATSPVDLPEKSGWGMFRGWGFSHHSSIHDQYRYTGHCRNGGTNSTLENAGADIVRVSCPDEDSSAALKEIVKQVNVPIVADIHFHYKRAIGSAKEWCGVFENQSGKYRVWKTVSVMLFKQQKIIIVRSGSGVNAGSLERDLLEKYGEPCPDAMVESAQRHIKILEDHDFIISKYLVRLQMFFWPLPPICNWPMFVIIRFMSVSPKPED